MLHDDNEKLILSTERRDGKDFHLERNAVDMATRLVIGAMELTGNSGKGNINHLKIETRHPHPRVQVEITAQEEYIDPSRRKLSMILVNPNGNLSEIESWFTKTHQNRYGVYFFNATPEESDEGVVNDLLRLFESRFPFTISCGDKTFGAYWDPLRGTIGLRRINTDHDWKMYVDTFNAGIPDEALYADRGADL